MTPHQLNTFLTLLGVPTTDTFPDRVKFLMENDLILLNDENRYICTAKGEAHIRHLCRLPLPQEAWVDHNGKLL